MYIYIQYIQLVCLANAQGGLRVTKHDGKQQFSLSKTFTSSPPSYCYLLSSVSSPPLLFKSFLSLPPSVLSLPAVLPLFLSAVPSLSLLLLPVPPTWMFSSWFHRDAHEGDSFLPCGVRHKQTIFLFLLDRCLLTFILSLLTTSLFPAVLQTFI